MKDALFLLQRHDTNDPTKIAAEMNVKVLYEDLGNGTWGYYTQVRRVPVIHVNNRLDEFESRFTCAHELGHHIKHQGINTPFLRRSTLFFVDRIEHEANQFAVHLLVGDTVPEINESKERFLFRCNIPVDFHVFY